MREALADLERRRPVAYIVGLVLILDATLAVALFVSRPFH